MPRRAPQTLADYMVVGISPALVMFMVGSLLWFLTIVFYQGDYTWRLLFVHAMFIMGVVSTTRISMEEGAAYAATFAVPLALVVAIAYVSFVKVEGALAPISPLINLMLEGVIWFSAHKLTWDCTLIDDSQDSSKEGLLQAMGWDRVDGEIAPPHAAAPAAQEVEQTAPPADQDATSSREVQVFNWLQSFFVPDKRPHTPGVWIIYFSLAALPLFGIGQWFIPSNQLELRRDAFWLLVVYVACGLGLLLNTSFLGLRRYLRQRNLLMPTDMAATWLGVGVAMILAVLVLVYLLPRPSSEYSVSQLDVFKSKPLDPSRWGWGKDGSKQPSAQQNQKPASGEGGQKSDKSQSSKSGDSKNQTSGKGSKDGGGKGSDGKDSSTDKAQGRKSSGGKGTGKDKSGDGSKSQESGSDGQKGDSKSGNKSDKSGGKQKPFDKEHQQSDSKNDQSSQQKSDRQPDNQSSQDSKQNSSSRDSEKSPQENSQDQGAPSADSSDSRPPPTSSFRPTQLLSWLSPTFAQIIQWLFYALVIVTLIALAWIYRAQIVAAWKKLLTELRELWARWFGGKQAAATSDLVPASTPPRPFATYADPFASGLAGRANLAELVRYTFEALEAWGREHNSPRAVGQTAHEYARQVGFIHEPLAGDVRFLAELYGQLAYAQSSVRQANTEPLRSLWQQMRLASGGV